MTSVSESRDFLFDLRKVWPFLAARALFCCAIEKISSSVCHSSCLNGTYQGCFLFLLMGTYRAGVPYHQSRFVLLLSNRFDRDDQHTNGAEDTTRFCSSRLSVTKAVLPRSVLNTQP